MPQFAYLWEYKDRNGNWTTVVINNGQTQRNKTLTIMDGDFYGLQIRCAAANDYGTTYSNIVTPNWQAGYDFPPVVILQPASTIEAEVGKSVALTGLDVSSALFATGLVWYVSPAGSSTFTPISTSGLDYTTWNVNGQDNHRPDWHYIASVLRLNSVTSAVNGYRFRFYAFNSVGNVWSNILTLQVKAPPVVTSQPSNTSATNSGTATFSVTATGATSYEWQFNTGSGDTWTKCTAASYKNVNTATLTINPVVSGFNGYRYRCAVTNADGTTYSAAATLTVN